MSVLLLAGTAEARALASLLASRRIAATASLAGVTGAPAPLALPTRTGGFGGVEGLADWLRGRGTRAVIDATHPYAEIMQENARAACGAAGVPRLRLLRPPWPARPGWRSVADAQDAASLLPDGAQVLLTSGRKELTPFLARTDCRIVLRTIEAVPDLPGHFSPLLARPPFTLRDEEALMRAHGITHLVTKNAGGAGTAKLDAAGALGLSVIVIARPAPPAGPMAATPEVALDWLDRLPDVVG